MAVGGTVLVVTGGGDDVTTVRGARVLMALDGGAGTNTLDLSSSSAPTTWAITGVDAGSVAGVTFIGV